MTNDDYKGQLNYWMGFLYNAAHAIGALGDDVGDPGDVDVRQVASSEVEEARQKILKMFDHATCDHKFAMVWSGSNIIGRCARCNMPMSWSI